MPASPSTMLPIANRRAASTESMSWVIATSWKAWFDWLTAIAFQNRTIAVCSGERTVLFTAP